MFLPANWRGYSVVDQQWNAAASADTDQVAAWHGPVIVLRHPEWKADDPCQDIPIMVFTRSQWEACHDSKFFPYAGGVISEMWHSDEYVFGLYSRYNWGELKGWKEAAEIVEGNSAAQAMPHLYPE